MKKPWPPGFQPKLTPTPATSRKKAEAARKAREARAAAGVRAWGTNTVMEKP